MLQYIRRMCKVAYALTCECKLKRNERSRFYFNHNNKL